MLFTGQMMLLVRLILKDNDDESVEDGNEAEVQADNWPKFLPCFTLRKNLPLKK